MAAVRAAVARRANRRIIMRQVGDRLIPVGITSGRMHLPTAEEAAQAENGEGGAVNDRGSRRRRRNQNQEINQLLGLGGQDLEEVNCSLTISPFTFGCGDIMLNNPIPIS